MAGLCPGHFFWNLIATCSLFFVVAGLVLSDFGFAEVADTTSLRDALPT